jgi:hypothetical protein
MRPNLGFGLPRQTFGACDNAGVCLRDCHMVFHAFAGFSIVTLGLHLGVDLRDAAFCLLYKALHFYGEGSFLTLPLALYRVNPLLGRQT